MRTLPQASGDVETAMALVCTVPATGRNERRIDLASVIQRATAVTEIAAGVELAFEGSAEVARMVVDLTLAERECCAQFTYAVVFAPRCASLRLRVEGEGALVRPLKDLYLGLAGTVRHV